MKHKAQEALNYIADEYLEVHCEGRPKNKDTESLLLIQQLIDLQLTGEEIGAILACMSYYHLRNGKTMNEIDVGYGEELFLKLMKQKELWEDDQCQR